MARQVKISMASSIYHHPNCPYVKRIRYKNLITIPAKEALHHGCRACKHCNSMPYLLHDQQPALELHKKKHKMDYHVMGNHIYIKTSISGWKLVYSQKPVGILLYHRNTSDQPFCLGKAEKEHYHRQKDCACTLSIHKLLTYIYEHDRFREAQQNGLVLTHFSSKRSQILARRSERKAERKRIDMLFSMLEKENPGLKELSFC